MTRHVIVGWGVAGMTAAEAIRSGDDKAEILILSDERHLFYSRPGLAYLLAGMIPESQLFPRTKIEFDAQRLRIRHAHVTSILPAEKAVELEDGNRVRYDRLLLALGASAVRPPIQGVGLDGVVTLDSLDDVRRILKFTRRARRAVVIGGGITALELAEGLASRSVETHYLLRGARYWRNVLDEQESRIIERGLMDEGVRLHYRSEIAEIFGRKGRVKGIELVNGKRMKCDVVAIAIGIRPRVGLARDAGILTDRGILVDEFMRTNHEGIYAAGDVAQVYDPLSGVHILDSLWWVAREQGAVAGANMVGSEVVYRKPPAFNVTHIGGHTVTIIGSLGSAKDTGSDPDMVAIARGDSETWRAKSDLFAIKEEDGENRVRVVVDEQTLRGALIMGDQTLSKPLQDLITSQVDIRPIRANLLSGDGQSEKLLLEYWDHWRRTDAVV